MRVNVWLVYKANEPRIYTRTEEPSADQKAAYKLEGFQLFRDNSPEYVFLTTDNGEVDQRSGKTPRSWPVREGRR